MIPEMALALSVSSDTGDLADIIHYINEQCHASNWQELDEALKHLDLSKCSEVAIICWLRTSFCVKDKLTNYPDLLYRARDHFTQKGEDAERILRGLL